MSGPYRLSIDFRCVPHHRRFAVGVELSCHSPDESDLTRLFRIGLAHGGVRILRRIDRILDGGWRRL